MPGNADKSSLSPELYSVCFQHITVLITVSMKEMTHPHILTNDDEGRNDQFPPRIFELKLWRRFMRTAIKKQTINGNNHNRKQPGAWKTPRARRRKLPYQEVERLHWQGMTGIAIAAQLGLKSGAVYSALRTMGLPSGPPKHEREVLPDGKMRCSIGHEIKEASKFADGYSSCKEHRYAQMAKESNQDLDKAIHFRNLRIRSRAKILGIYYDLTDDQLTELYISQGGRCAYCRKPMVMKLGVGRNDRSGSIERTIPHKLGGTYTIKNVLWVHFGCNRRRGEMTGKRLKESFPGASKAIEKVAHERHLELPFPTDSEINLADEAEPQLAAV
jgi:hypothetical protein